MYGIGGDGLLRLFVTLQYPDGDHLFALVWEGSSAADFRAFAVLTQPILDSIRVPDRYVGFHQTVPERSISLLAMVGARGLAASLSK